MSKEHLITIFTATYNREQLILQLYESLQEQSCKNFEWLIVDDGSNDNTEGVVQTLIEKELSFSIRYFKQYNQGKHIAINTGLSKAKGDYFFIVDSDDRLPYNSIENINNKIDLIDQNEGVAGVVGLKCFFNKTVVGSDSLKEDLLCSLFDYRYSYKHVGDRAEVIKTKIFKNYLFPKFENENFVPESIVWNEIAQKYKLLFFPINVYECEYLIDGLSSKSTVLRRKNPVGTADLYAALSNVKSIPFLFKLKANINFWRFYWALPNTIKLKYFKLLGITPYIVPSFIIGSLFYLKDSILI